MDGAQTQPGQIGLSVVFARDNGPAQRRGLFCVRPASYLKDRKDIPMPLHKFLLLLLAVIFAAGVTVWLLSQGSPGLLVAALPAFLIAAAAIRYLRR